MRWTFAIIVLINAIWFAWLVSTSEASAPVKPRPQPLPVGESIASLTLLDEAGDLDQQLDTQVVESVAVDEEQIVPESQAAAAPQCGMAGIFPEEISAKQFVQRLQSLDINGTISSVSVTSGIDYWVHVKPQLSRKQSMALLAEMQSQGIDSFLIGKGELEYGISLGFFTREDGAMKQRDIRRAQGYEVDIAEVPRRHTELWVQFKPEEYAKMSEELWSRLAVDMPYLENRRTVCVTELAESEAPTPNP